MAHIRYATQGGVSLENVHPFQREMWGIQWTFAHNGDVPMFTRSGNPNTPLEEGSLQQCGSNLTQAMPMLGRCSELIYHPVGDTDSEAVFCAMLNALRAEFTTLPTLPVLYEAIQRLCSEIVRGKELETIFNFLLGCGQFTMFAFSWPGSRVGSTVWNGLHYLVRYPPFSKAVLKDVDYAGVCSRFLVSCHSYNSVKVMFLTLCCHPVDFSDTNGETDRVAIIDANP